DVYYSSQDGIQHWDGSTLTQVTDGNTRMLELVGSVLYASTASTGTALPYSTGGGIYKFVNPNGVPTITHEITLVGTPPTSTVNCLSFKFANANNCYLGLQQGNGFGGLHKFWFNGTGWEDKGSAPDLGTDWGRGVDVVVNGNNVRIYVDHTSATSDGAMS